MRLCDWLDQPLNPHFVANRYKSRSRDVRDYYLPHDDEITMQDPGTAWSMSDGAKLGTQLYTDVKGHRERRVVVHVPSNTRRYEADTLFRRLLDHSVIYGNDIVTPDMRASFYAFVQKFS
jgi:hypothetical protein